MIPNIAVIGFGYWGKNLVRNFHQLGALRAICDADPSRAEATRSNYPDVVFYHHIDQVHMEEYKSQYFEFRDDTNH